MTQLDPPEIQPVLYRPIFSVQYRLLKYPIQLLSSMHVLSLPTFSCYHAAANSLTPNSECVSRNWSKRGDISFPLDRIGFRRLTKLLTGF
jgi:hypothetical protein